MKIKLNLKRAEKGQSLVELAFGLVVLLILLAGVVELGRLMFQFITIRDAAEEGAIFGSVYPKDCNQTVERVRGSLYNTNRSEINVYVRIVDPANSSNNWLCTDAGAAAHMCSAYEINVTVEQPNYPVAVPFLGAVLGRQTIPLRAEATSAIIRPIVCP